MGDIKVGDIVARISYGSDILFRVKEIKSTENQRIAILRGLDMRLMADAPLSDLRKASTEEMKVAEERVMAQAREYLRRGSRPWLGDFRRAENRYGMDNLSDYQSFPGRILHLDGDDLYFQKCMARYKELKLDVAGAYIPERDQPEAVTKMLKDAKPDLLVITGHDGLIKGKAKGDIENYYTSAYFAATVKQARIFAPSLDELFIFAGACQSFYEAIILAGANFASSPQRILIHAFDPLLVVKAVAYTSIGEVINPRAVIQGTISGLRGIGGLETWGRFRLGLPPFSDNHQKNK